MSTVRAQVRVELFIGFCIVKISLPPPVISLFLCYLYYQNDALSALISISEIRENRAGSGVGSMEAEVEERTDFKCKTDVRL